MIRYLWVWCCVVSIAVVAASPNRAYAASEPIDLSSSDWDLTGSMKASVKKVGKLKVTGTVQLVFGPNVSEGLDEGEFKLVDGEGDSLVGTHETPKKVAELSPDDTSLEDYLTAKIQQVADEEGVDVVVNEVLETSVKVSAKPKSVKTGISLSLRMKIKASVDMTVDGESVVAKISVTIKGKGLIETTLDGTRWSFDSNKIKASIKGLGRVRYVGTLDVISGPNAGEGLGAGEIKVTDDEGNVFTGTWSLEGKKVTIDLDEGPLEDFLEDLVEEEVDGAADASVDITKITATARLKHGVSLKLKLKIKFDVEGTIDGEPVSGSGSFSNTGTGVPTESVFASNI